MELWHLWTSLLSGTIAYVSTSLGVSDALAIIGLTAIVRAALMPISLAAALRAEHTKERLRRLKPELAALKLRLAGDAPRLAEATMALYREHDVRFVDRLMLLNLGTQSVFGIGLYQAIGKSGLVSRFLWIGSLAKPDLWLTVVVAILMAAGMAAMPGTFADPSTIAMLVVAVVVTPFIVAALPSSIGLYWATSNAFAILQSLSVRALVARRRFGHASQ